jgi:hypothetical protein
VLAYVFWHRPSPGTGPAGYEDALGQFHEALSGSPPAGFRRSLVFRTTGVPWLSGAVYEDWYLLEGSHALDPLDIAAVTSRVGEGHDAVAALAGDGAGGLYRLRAGEPRLEGDGTAVWFSKPSGHSYESLYERLAPWSGAAGAGLWGRQMVLGPTPEFCLRGRGPLELPSELEPVPVATRQVWP